MSWVTMAGNSLGTMAPSLEYASSYTAYMKCGMQIIKDKLVNEKKEWKQIVSVFFLLVNRKSKHSMAHGEQVLQCCQANVFSLEIPCQVSTGMSQCGP